VNNFVVSTIYNKGPSNLIIKDKKFAVLLWWLRELF